MAPFSKNQILYEFKFLIIFRANPIQSNPILWDTKMDWNAFHEAFKGVKAKQRQEIVQQMKKICKEDLDEGQLEKESQLIRLSLTEFIDHIKNTLTHTKIKQLLRETGSRKLYRLLYGDVNRIDTTEDDIFNPKVEAKEGDWDDESRGHVDEEGFLTAFISLLKRFNTKSKTKSNKDTRNDDRLQFHIFIDTCWLTVNFDTIGLGNYEQVFDQEKCPSSSYNMSNKLKPNALRKICIDYLKAFILTTVQLDWKDIDIAMQVQIDAEFTGVCIIVIIMTNILIFCSCLSHSYLQKLLSQRVKV